MGADPALARLAIRQGTRTTRSVPLPTHFLSNFETGAELANLTVVSRWLTAS